MPRGDGTGPWGQGPMTGWGAGFCRGYGMRGYAGSVRGGFGRGHGTDMSKVEEIEALRQQAEYFQANLEDIQKRLDNLESADQ